MTIESEINRIKENIENTYIALENKGVTLPAERNSDNLAVTIDSISIGGNEILSVEAVNKTSSLINKGDRVWINSIYQNADTNYSIGQGNYGADKLVVVDRSGNFGWYYNKFYNIDTEQATSISSENLPSLGVIRYDVDNSMLATQYNISRIDGKAQWNKTGYDYLGGGLIATADNIFEVDMENGSIKNTFTNSLSGSNTPSNGCITIGNYIYLITGNSSKNLRWLIDATTNTFTVSNYTMENPPHSSQLFPVGITSDYKYIICGNLNIPSAVGRQDSNYLYLIEILEDGNLKGLLASEMPVDLQKWFSTACSYTFNPYTGILCVCGYNTSDYGIYKYENGEWTQLSIDLGVPENGLLKGPITVSDDLSRAAYSYYENGTTNLTISVIVNLKSIDGYTAVPYRFYTVNENTQTGYAAEDAEINASFQVSLSSFN